MMRDLLVIEVRNQQLAQEYRANTTPKERIQRRLHSLALTSAEQNALILAAFDVASTDEQARMADEREITDLLAAANLL